MDLGEGPREVRARGRCDIESPGAGFAEAGAGNDAILLRVSSLRTSASNGLTPSPSLDLLREVAATGVGGSEDLSGTTVGRYKLQRLLGAGGMGVVYAAEDTTLARTVAVKLLRGKRTNDPERRRRFLLEARLASAVNHANVATVYDAGIEDGLGVFIAMELCAGVSLRRHAHGVPLAPSEVVRIGVEIARALEAAHQRKVIHRDLKPDNVMVLPDGAIKVLDFGVAKSMVERTTTGEAAPLTAGDVLTVDGVVVGTPSYMSPEQARGDELDGRSDVYSLGVVLFELATGERPTPPGLGSTEASARLAETRPRVPKDLARAILRCLEPDPARRWADAKALAMVLQAGDREPHRHRRRFGVAMGAMAVVAGVAFVATRGGPWGRAPAASATAVAVLPDTWMPTSTPSPPPLHEPSPVEAHSKTTPIPMPCASVPAPLDKQRARQAPAATASASASVAKQRPPRDPLDEQK